MARRRRTFIRMIVDREMCLRVQPGDEREARPSTPMHCPVCHSTPKSVTPYPISGRLMFDGEPTPQCEDHESPVAMVAA